MLIDPDTKGFQERHTIRKNSNVRRRAADIQSDSILPAPGHSENPHDAGSGTGQDLSARRKFKRLSNIECTPVGLEDINRDRDALMADESQDLLNESAV